MWLIFSFSKIWIDSVHIFCYIIHNSKHMNTALNFSAINLGCSKNLVDLEYTVWEILKLSSETEINFFPDPEDDQVEYVLINTCGFLSSSRDEAESTIQYYDDLWKKLIIIGCYVPVKNDTFVKNLKNLHSIVAHEDTQEVGKMLIGNEKLEKLKRWVGKLKQEKLKKYLESIQWDRGESKAFVWGSENVRAFFNAPLGHEYLKIAEWCNNTCSFCIIPKIRGKQKSRTIEDIVEEVNVMVKSWIREIEIISQDTTRYGVDLYNKPQLLELLEAIDQIEGDFVYRLFYMYPDVLSFTHLDRLSKLTKMLPYFDMPFQHISPNVLKNMWRFYDEKHIFKLLDYIKKLFPNAFFHTNFIVGFPWETQEDFEMLLDFAKKYEFDSVSLFWFHDEVLAPSFALPNKIDAQTIASRVEELSTILNAHYDAKDALRTWKELEGIIQEIADDGTITVREVIRAPDIDDYDTITADNVISWEIQVWGKICYK